MINAYKGVNYPKCEFRVIIWQQFRVIFYNKTCKITMKLIQIKGKGELP